MKETGNKLQKKHIKPVLLKQSWLFFPSELTNFFKATTLFYFSGEVCQDCKILDRNSIFNFVLQISGEKYFQNQTGLDLCFDLFHAFSPVAQHPNMDPSHPKLPSNKEEYLCTLAC